MPPRSVQYAAATDGRRAGWIFGGIGDGEKPTAETAAYDRAINTWTRGTEAAASRCTTSWP